jgi:DNA-binding MarR family transcriptional regulator
MSPPRKSPATAARAPTKRMALEIEALLSARALVDRMRELYRELERMTEAPITVHRALTCIGEDPGLAASQLAVRLGMQRPAVSHVLKGLVARGWIERRRHEGDQRSVRIHPTAEGLQILRATAGRAVGTLQRAVRGLNHTELQQLATGLASLLRRLPESSNVGAGAGRARSVPRGLTRSMNQGAAR